MKSLKSAVIAFCLASFLTTSLRGATYIISNPSDTTNKTSLRGAIIAANAAGGSNVIMLTNTIYNLTIQGSNEDASFTGDLDVTNGALTIAGEMTSPSMINATNLGDRVFQVFSNAQLTMSNIVITGGAVPADTSYTDLIANGGGIYNSGTLILLNCVLSNNASGENVHMGGSGGGIFNNGQCTMTNCMITSNSSGSFLVGGTGGYGGGLCNEGNAALVDCTVSSNICAQGSPGLNAGFVGGGTGGLAGGNGGGISNSNALQLISCTIANNSAGAGGPGGTGEGYYSGGGGGAGGLGGGFYNAGSAELIACTVASNATGAGGVGGSAPGAYPGTFVAGGGNGGNGGGIYNVSNATVIFLNTLIAQNVAANGGAGGVNEGTINGPAGKPGSGPDASGAFTSDGFNLIGEGNGLSGLTNGVTNDLVGATNNPINPLLGPLQNNGGDTLTFALLSGSPAIDAGDDSLLSAPYYLTTDQRGYERKAGLHVDIGAYEYDATLNNSVPPPTLIDPTLETNGFQFSFSDTSGLIYSVWASTNLTSWTKIGTATEQSLCEFIYIDTSETNYNYRFYEVRYP
jgi:hypothetical protein